MSSNEFVKRIVKKFLKKKLNYDLPDNALDVKDLNVDLNSNGIKLHLNFDLDIPYAEVLKLWKTQ